MDHLLLFPSQASTIAGQVDALMIYVFLISVVFAGGIALTILFFSWRYHHQKAVDRTNPPTFSLAVELIWTGVPLVLVLSIFVWGAKLFVDAHQPPGNALEMYVVGRQWMWKLQHPEGAREINELHVPVGQPVKLIMTSEDVIHSFFVPEFRVKQDVLPGRYSSLWFEATRPGRYHLFCAEFCGTSHSGMVGSVVALPPLEFAAWLSNRGAAPGENPSDAPGVSMAAAGEQLADRLACLTCHRADGGGTAPSFVKLFGSKVQLASGETATADEGYIRTSIIEPNRQVVKGYQPVMPTFQGQVNEEQLLQLIAYIKGLDKP